MECPSGEEFCPYAEQPSGCSCQSSPNRPTVEEMTAALRAAPDPAVTFLHAWLKWKDTRTQLTLPLPDRWRTKVRILHGAGLTSETADTLIAVAMRRSDVDRCRVFDYWFGAAIGSLVDNISGDLAIDPFIVDPDCRIEPRNATVCWAKVSA